MFLIPVLLVVLVSVPLTGGRLSALSGLRVRHAWAPASALLLQVLIISIVPSLPDGLLALGHVASYTLLGYFMWHNRSIAGLWLIGLGWALNLAAIAANGGVMPTGEAVAGAAPRDVPAGEFVNSRVLEDPKLEFLGDVFALPDAWPLQNVFSVGDVLIAAGAIVVLHVTCRTWPARAAARRLASVA